MELFVSDLDGTLLNSVQKISVCSAAIINNLLAEGMQFSIATARGLESTAEILAPLSLTLPIIISNGAFVYDPRLRLTIKENLLGEKDAKTMLACLKERAVSVFVFTFDEKGERHIYYKEPLNRESGEYFADRVRQGDTRFRKITNYEDYSKEKIFKLVAIGQELKLRPVYEALKTGSPLHFDFTQDIYSKAYWLEIAHPEANKRDALRWLQHYIGADRLICFGDNLNDCPMFEIADVRLAMSNAHAGLKQMATRIIASNNENGVAEYLHKWHNHDKLNSACTNEVLIDC
ncbi:MAG: HAD-IIB family hydrolase [Pelosinus sp.]|nr:HAD-IIB family hydrolase [Pelosinus sp.]